MANDTFVNIFEVQTLNTLEETCKNVHHSPLLEHKCLYIMYVRYVLRAEPQSLLQ